jgi:hypothetical protein
MNFTDKELSVLFSASLDSLHKALEASREVCAKKLGNFIVFRKILFLAFLCKVQNMQGKEHSIYGGR